MTTEALVQTVNIPVYGRDGTYSFEKLGERSFGRWATHVRELLTAHATLARAKLIPRDSILEAAKDALWNTYPALADVPMDYEIPSMATATSAAGVAARVQWHLDWLKKITHACAPSTSVEVLDAMRQVRFGGDGPFAESTYR